MCISLLRIFVEPFSLAAAHADCGGVRAKVSKNTFNAKRASRRHRCRRRHHRFWAWLKRFASTFFFGHGRMISSDVSYPHISFRIDGDAT